MEVLFGDNDLRERLEDHQKGIRAWGIVVARKYVQRILQLQAAKDQAEVQALRSLRLHPLTGERSGDWSMILHDRWRLLVRFEGPEVHVLEVTNHYGD